MKKLIATILCAALAVSFVGCGKDSPSLEEYKMITVLESGDAYVGYDPENAAFEFGTEAVKQTVAADKSGFGIRSLVNKTSGAEYVGEGKKLGFRFTEGEKEYTSEDLELTYKDYAAEIAEHGEIVFTLSLGGKKYDVEYTFTIYPGTSLIKSRYKLINTQKNAVSLKNLSFIDFEGTTGEEGSEKLVYMTGGGNFTGSLLLKENSISDGYSKTMLSYDEREVATNSKGYYDSTQDQWNGYSGYEPFFALQNARSGGGIYFGFEYAGLWEASVKKAENISLKAGLTLYTKTLEKGESFLSPEAFWGTFTDNLDNATNDLLYYQYEYNWDETGEIFPLCTTDTWSSLSKVSFENVVALSEQARYLGLDMVHIDDNLSGVGWYDKKMDWNNTFDVRSISDYLHASGMKSSVWATTQHYDYTSDAIGENKGLEIPELDSGYYGPLLCVGNDKTLSFMKEKLDDIVSRNALDMVKTDGWVIAPCDDISHSHSTDDNGCSASYSQYYGFLDYLESACKNNPGFSWIMCASGGELHGFEFLKYATYVTTTDGAAENPVNSLSYLFPSGKFQSGYAQVQSYSPANTRTYGFVGGLCTILSVEDTSEEYAANKEKMRGDVALYRYLRNSGVLGRYSKQYHLTTAVLGQSLYMKTDREADRAVVMGIPAGYDKKIYPVGLKADKTYTVSFYNNKNYYTATGKDLLEKGISVEGCAEGEMIFFNMPLTPQSGRDKTAPVMAENSCTAENAIYAGVSGVALRWDAATDDNFVSYYDVYKNGAFADRVSSGTFWFDKTAADGDEYEVRAADGDDNVSSFVRAARR
jgi:hypothetical protein